MRGSCLCGEVAWDVEGPFEGMHHCHCSRCRKSHGAVYATYVSAPGDGFRWRPGAPGAIARFASSPGFERCFCGRCGSVLPGAPGEWGVFVPAGTLDGDPGVRPESHIFHASRAPWLEVADALPRHDAYPPGVDAAPVETAPNPEPARAGAPRGSCLCGAVRFVVEGPLLRAQHCHCGRCRKARAAAFATNLFTPAGGVRVTQGAERLRSYKLPDAKFFTQVFCGTCGRKAPRVDPARDLAVVPMGVLDDDPGLRPQRHIFVASIAPWDAIADDLPRFDEGAP